MDHNLENEDVSIQVKDKLHKEGVKLWLKPYYNINTGPSDEELKHLALNYSKSLNLSYNCCHAVLLELQFNALEKLKQINQFKETGLATVKIKILMQDNSPKILTIEILLSILGLDMKKLLAEKIDIPLDRIKLISGGIIIKDDESLMSQGIKNSSQILTIVLSESLTEIIEGEHRAKDVETTKADTSLLALDDGYMELEDQHGNTINIPMKEKQSLMVAMALHEKGRSALKKEDYAKALVFFLDADKEFSLCNSQLLKSVDNYALLDLDIAWCYLCLKSFVHLPEAYERLKRCQDAFHEIYGPNFERLIALKGSAGNEAALLMRLHLLQAIVLYHQNKRQEAYELLLKVNRELLSLKVDDQSIAVLIELGYSSAEARLGLRASHGDVNMAANSINEKRNLRAESRRKAVAEKIFRKESKKLGLCADGKQFVDPNFVKMLVNMGFGREAAIRALQKTNNVISDGIEYIQENPLPGPSNTKSQECLSLIEHLVTELQAAGFDYEKAKLALQNHNGDIMMAAEELLLNKDVINEGVKALLSVKLEDNGNKQDVESEKQKQLKEDALSRLSEDISMIDDDHLDLTLQKEEEFLTQYLSLLENK